MRNLAIITARSGSKGLPDKNIRLLDGKPLIAYTIEAALESGLFDTVLASTDSDRYAEVARRYGAEVPFLRSTAASSDSASSWDAVREALDGMEAMGRPFDSFMLLQPTSPLRDSADITGAFSLLEEKRANAVVSVCEVDHSPLWCNVLPEDGSLKDFRNPKIAGLRRQALPTYYRINGAMYLVVTRHFRTGEDIFSDGCYAFVMERRKSVDIDDLVDFLFAEAVLRARNAG